MRTLFAREPGEPGSTPVKRGRSGKATSRKPDMYAARQSHGGIVPVKQPNDDNQYRASEEAVEGRPPAKGNRSRNTHGLDTVPDSRARLFVMWRAAVRLSRTTCGKNRMR